MIKTLIRVVEIEFWRGSDVCELEGARDLHFTHQW